MGGGARVGSHGNPQDAATLPIAAQWAHIAHCKKHQEQRTLQTTSEKTDVAKPALSITYFSHSILICILLCKCSAFNISKLSTFFFKN